MKERIALIDRSHPLSIRRQSHILSINRSQLYYKPAGENEENLMLMETMDMIFLSDPTLGVLGMQDELTERGLNYNVKRIRRLLRKMAIEPIYPKRNLSRLGKAKYIHPYLLKGLELNRPNQAWALDITYIPMKHGFMYLTAIMDLYSRYIVGWQLSNSLEKETQTELLQATISKHGKPELINSDQGAQYTCEHWVSTLNDLKIRISMDGKGRATHNAHIERWFRTIKQKYVYLNPEKNGLDLYQGINRFVNHYNSRKHQGIDRKKPMNLYLNTA
jgi:putative transposase